MRLAFRMILRIAPVLAWTVLGQSARGDVVRVVNWNVTNYSGGRVAEFQTAIYGVFQGRSLSPDVFIGEEFVSGSAVTAFLNLLNQAPASPGDWAAADFVDGPDSDTAFFYRTGKVALATELSPNGVTVVAVGGPAPNHPRNIMRYDLVLSPGTTGESRLAVYGVHMKAGSTADDQARRLLEAQRIRDNAESLPTGWHFLLGGDFNVQASIQGAYQELTATQANDAGRFVDPIKTPGSWSNTAAFRFVHTQDPSGAGGMDDRHDQLLVSNSLVDGEGADYVGDPNTPYSTVTWNDPKHSYRSWGNDGSSFNASLAITGNQMVGATIAQALVTSALGGGHLPVFLDLRVAPCPADAECDGGTDLADYREFVACRALPLSSFCAEYFDLDGDGDVDLLDFGWFQTAFD